MLSFLRGNEDCSEAKFGDHPLRDEALDFGLNWLIDEDRNQI